MVDAPPTKDVWTPLTGHELKRLVKKEFGFLIPTSAKFCKSNVGWRADQWVISIETSKVFVTNEEKTNETKKIRNFITDTITSRHGTVKSYDVDLQIFWPMTIEEVNAKKEEELKKEREEAERIQLETQKRQRIEEENAELDRVLRPKLLKKEMGTMEEYFDRIRNEKFDEQVRAMWRAELNRKAEVVLLYPFKERETMRNELPNIEEYIRGVVPHVSGGDYREPFFGKMDRVFRQSKYNICKTVRDAIPYYDGCDYRFTNDTFECCIRLYHSVHRNPEGCSVDKLRLYSLIFVV